MPKMNVNKALTKDYEKNHDFRRQKTKPKQSQFQNHPKSKKTTTMFTKINADRNYCLSKLLGPHNKRPTDMRCCFYATQNFNSYNSCASKSGNKAQKSNSKTPFLGPPRFPQVKFRPGFVRARLGTDFAL